uniref:Uncharacterized protein n=1 Tax=Arion vulgaris TaxID=1028688 RepID=A0A0B7BG05_9EUPU
MPFRVPPCSSEYIFLGLENLKTKDHDEPSSSRHRLLPVPNLDTDKTTRRENYHL